MLTVFHVEDNKKGKERDGPDVAKQGELLMVVP